MHKIVVPTLVLVFVLTLCGCFSVPNTSRESVYVPEDGLVSFHYNFGTSSVSTTYDVYLEDGTVQFFAKTFNCGEMEMDIDAETTEDILQQLNTLVKKEDLAKWNGKNTSSNESQAGGYVYSMEIIYMDGTTIRTSGNGIPDGLEAVDMVVTEFFNNYIDTNYTRLPQFDTSELSQLDFYAADLSPDMYKFKHNYYRGQVTLTIVEIDKEYDEDNGAAIYMLNPGTMQELDAIIKKYNMDELAGLREDTLYNSDTRFFVRATRGYNDAWACWMQTMQTAHYLFPDYTEASSEIMQYIRNLIDD